MAPLSGGLGEGDTAQAGNGVSPCPLPGSHRPGPGATPNPRPAAGTTGPAAPAWMRGEPEVLRMRPVQAADEQRFPARKAKRIPPLAGRPGRIGRSRVARILADVVVIVLLAGLYFAAGKLGLMLAFAHPSATAVWPPAGIALAALLLLGYRVWPGILLGAFLVNLLTAGSVATSVGIAAGNTLEGLLGAYLVNRFARGRRAFDRPQDVFKWVALAGLASTTVSATFGATSLWLGGFARGTAGSSIWLTWWLGDAVAVLTVAPLLVLWGVNPRLRWDRRRVFEAVLLALSVALVGLTVFGRRFGQHPLQFLCLPLLVWAAFRFGQRGAATAGFGMAALALWGTLRGFGPFARQSGDEGLLLLEAFTGVFAVSALALAAGEAERKRALASLWASEDTLQVALRAGRMGTWDWDVRTGEVAWSPTLEALHGLAPGTFGGTYADFLEAVHPEDRDAVTQAVARAVDQGAEHHLEYRMLWPDGSVHWAEGRGRLVHDKTGKLVRMLGVCLDVTERKQAERRLAAEHAVTRILAESAGLTDAAPRILQALCESLGWDVGLLWGVDRRANVLRCLELWHVPPVAVPALEEVKRQATFAPGAGLPGRIWAGGSPAWIPDVARDGNFPRAQVAVREGLHGAVGFPMRSGVEFLGVMEFFSREIRQPDEELLQMMSSIGSQVSQFIERRQAEKAWHERQREFALAREIQRGALPRATPVLAGFEIGGASHPAQETGGDYFDFLPLPDGSLGIAIGDASGHGIGAALLMAATCAYIRALALAHAEVDQILTLVNRRLAEDSSDDQFITLFLARLDPATRSLVHSNAGHWPGYVLDARGKVKAVLPSTGVPLGIEPVGDFPSAAATALEPGDLVVLLTDGVVETVSPDGTLFGVGRALDVVRAHRGGTPRQVAEALLQTANDFSGDVQIDDRTAVILKVSPSG
jgi:PAS domain S-box-containing protein